MLRSDLVSNLRTFNLRCRLDRTPPEVAATIAEALGLDWSSAHTSLAVYGSLAPGKMNHRQVSELGGDWQEATVRGHLHDRGWGSGAGFPGFSWDEKAGLIPVVLLASHDLPSAWTRLDRFEGQDYRRILVPVDVESRLQIANIYSIAEA